MPDDQTNNNYSAHANNLLNVTIQSHSCCNQKKTRWIVATINSIPCRPCVHPSINFVALNAEKSSSLHTIILEKHKQTKHLIILIFI